MFPISLLDTPAPNTATDGSGAYSWLIMLVPFALLAVFWIFSSRSQKKQDQALKNMRDSLMVGDEITTIGGIIGKIVSLKEETMVIETTRDHTRIRLLRSAVRSVDVSAAEKHAPKPAQPTEAEAPAEKQDAEQENN